MRFRLMDYFGLESKILILCNPMIALVAGGGFVPQSPTDSLELTDSTMVRNAKSGYKGNFFIQFSLSFLSLRRSIGFGHDLRAAVDSYKGGFRTLEVAHQNKGRLNISFGSAAPVFNRESRHCRRDGCSRKVSLVTSTHRVQRGDEL